jgi:serine kinase of HPr protein (carbohydrate metabolism regulator)
VRPGRSNAVLIETAARNHLLQRRGRHGARGFSDRLDLEIAQRRARRVGGGS